MTDKQTAEKIVELVGGKENIVSVRHCATRLRIIVADKDKIQTKEVENLEKVKGSFFNSGQYQIILGTGLVNRIYDETVKITGGADAGETAEEKKEVVYGNKFQRAIRMFSDVFVPIIPVLVATGLFMGLRGLLTQDAVLAVFGMTPDDVPASLLTFTQILTDTAFSFLPALVCWSTFRNFGGSPVIGIVLGLMLVSPSLPSSYDVGSGVAEPLEFFGFIRVAGYQGSVLPAFATGIITAKFEKWLRKHIPDAIDLIVTPFITLLVGIVMALFVLGPILHYVENGVLFVVENLLFLPLGIGGLLYGCFGQLLGIFGIHHILNFLEISMLAQDGWNYLNPIGTCGNVAQAGAVLAVAIKAASNKTKQVAYPSCLSALLGITEPAVFGVNLRFVKPFIMSMIGGGVGGFLASNLNLRATGMSITGIPGTLLYLNDQLPLYILVNVISFAVAFGLTWLFGFNKKMENQA
ncbi:MAG TPA: sucrose-specific PTS transporter subunit IIBC [Candidatus Mediterraneibacter caccogallinarum]|nr:sucrose-specific PTS transporter subunit IIBC [Candidatus Mediterraneibacter caccogallinarum]